MNKGKNKKEKDGFWVWLGQTLRNIFNFERSTKIFMVIATIILLILFPIAFGYLIDAPSLVDYVPFNSEDWFTYWVSYFSLISTILLDCLALFFAFMAYNNERQYKKYGFLYFNNMILSYMNCGNNKDNKKENNKDDDNNKSNNYKFKIEIIDFHPNLTHHQEVKIENFEMYALKNREILNNPKLLNSDQIRNYSLDLIYSQKIAEKLNNEENPGEDKNPKKIYFSRSSNERYSLFFNFDSDEKFLEEYLNFRTNSLDKRMLYITFNYEIVSKDSGRYNRFLNALIPSTKKTMQLFLLEEADRKLSNERKYYVIEENDEEISYNNTTSSEDANENSRKPISKIVNKINIFFKNKNKKIILKN